MPARRFPPPWTVEELEACFVVKDASGQKLGYFYYEEARRFAVNVTEITRRHHPGAPSATDNRGRRSEAPLAGGI
jgi:hypothetical protein